MTDSIETELERLRTALEGLQVQRSLLGEAVVIPALQSLQEKISTLEAQISAQPAANIERRIVTILFTDIVGSTALAEKMDPEEWREVVAGVHAMVGQNIEQRQGAVLQYLGDGLLALFGAHTSREYDSENAILAALDIQAGLSELKNDLPLQMRTGIHTGLVVVGELGSSSKREVTATGDAMNLAARLQSAAPPGGVLISQDTYRYVCGMFGLTPQEPMHFKGKSEPIQTYLVRRARPRQFRTVTRGVTGIVTRTIGRDAEIERLKTGYQKSMEGNQQVWTQLLGEAGLGKSRLLGEMLDFIAQQPVALGALRGRAYQGDEYQAFSLIRRMWFDLFQIAEDTPLGEAERLWEECFLAVRDPGGFEEAAHILGVLVGLPFKDSPYIGAMRQDPAQVRGRAFVVSRELLADLRASRPVIILLEDLQWVDSASWDYLVEVVLDRSASKHGLLVIATARPDWNPPQGLLEHSAFEQIDLLSLPESACHELVLELLQRVKGVPADLVGMIVERSEGVPYFAEEMVNWFLDRGIIDAGGEVWRFNPQRLQETPLPVTLQHLLLTRLGSLAESERLALQRGSIYGRNFWEDGLRALGIRAPGEVLPHLQQLNLIHQQSASTLANETEWSFQQNLLRDVTYESVLKSERKRLHRAAGIWLEQQARLAERLNEFAGVLGEHAERAGEWRTAALLYLRAGEYAKERYALPEARHFLDRAVEFLPPEHTEQRWQALLARSFVLGILSDAPNRQADIADLLALAQEMGDTLHLAEAYFHQGSYFHSIGDDQPALQAFDSALQAAQRSDSSKLWASVLGLKTVCLTRLGDLDAAALTAEEMLSLEQELIDPATRARVYINISIYYLMVGDLARAIQILKQQIEIQHREKDRAAEAIGLANLGYAYVQLGQYGLGCVALEQSLEVGQSIGAQRSNAYNRLNLGLAYCRLGNLQVAHQILEQSLTQLRDVGDEYGGAIGLAYLGLNLEQCQDSERALYYFDEARQMLNAKNMPAYALEATAGLARCALALRDPAMAQEYATEVWSYLNQHGVQGMEFPILAYLTCVQVFEALSMSEESQAALKAGYQELMQRAERISDLEWSKSYLTQVPEHRTIIALWSAHQDGSD
jgi:class 3 adenylate cyclase/tetratricopeptide (TPR) repeat protein